MFLGWFRQIVEKSRAKVLATSSWAVAKLMKMVSMESSAKVQQVENEI